MYNTMKNSCLFPFLVQVETDKGDSLPSHVFRGGIVRKPASRRFHLTAAKGRRTTVLPFRTSGLCPSRRVRSMGWFVWIPLEFAPLCVFSMTLFACACFFCRFFCLCVLRHLPGFFVTAYSRVFYVMFVCTVSCVEFFRCFYAWLCVFHVFSWVVFCLPMLPLFV